MSTVSLNFPENSSPNGGGKWNQFRKLVLEPECTSYNHSIYFLDFNKYMVSSSAFNISFTILFSYKTLIRKLIFSYWEISIIIGWISRPFHFGCLISIMHIYSTSSYPSKIMSESKWHFGVIPTPSYFQLA